MMLSKGTQMTVYRQSDTNTHRLRNSIGRKALYYGKIMCDWSVERVEPSCEVREATSWFQKCSGPLIRPNHSCDREDGSGLGNRTIQQAHRRLGDWCRSEWLQAHRQGGQPTFRPNLWNKEKRHSLRDAFTGEQGPRSKRRSKRTQSAREMRINQPISSVLCWTRTKKLP